jgi:hypothetical protein
MQSILSHIVRLPIFYWFSGIFFVQIRAIYRCRVFVQQSLTMGIYNDYPIATIATPNLC